MSTFYESNRLYFDRRMRKLDHYLSRFPGGIEFEGKKVLDLGCGHGALACTAALRGAQEVLGVDLDEQLVNFAQENQAKRFAETLDSLRFEVRDILEGGLADFDIVLSEATFEHVVGLDRYLGEIKNLLKEGGRLYTGYAPLFNAPWGDHRRLQAPLHKYFPWAHLLFPQQWLLKRLSKIEGRQVNSLHDLGLNGLSFQEHERLLKHAGLRVVFFEANNQSRWSMKCVELLRALPGLRELMTFSIYAILEKPKAAS